MKHKLIITSLIITILFTGCSSNTENVPETTTPTPEPTPIIQETEPPEAVIKPVSVTEKPVVTTPAETAPENKKGPNASEGKDKSVPIYTGDKSTSISGDPDSYIKGVKIPDNIYAPDLAKIGKADITDLKESADIGLWRAVCDGFAYLALPSDVSEYKRFNVGDSIMGFTVTEAETYFSNMYLTDDRQTEKTCFYRGGQVTLEGSVTLNGVVTVHGESGDSLYKNKVVFIPYADDNMLLPVYDIPDIVRQQYFGAAETGFSRLRECIHIILGDSEEFDVLGIDEGKSYWGASVTVDGIILRADAKLGAYAVAESAEIVMQ